MIFIKKNNLNTRIKAFTLVETLVSTMVITLVILGPLTVAMNASAYARQTKDTMIAIYLAQEATELLHHQQDSIFLRCTSTTSLACELMDYEVPSEAAWRIFRDRLGFNTQGVSCYAADSPSGCAFDFLDMLTDEDLNPPKYNAYSNECDTLYISADDVYVCNINIEGDPSTYKASNFKRTISVVSLKTFSSSDQDYNDDLRVTVTVTFKRINGFTRQLRVVDFFHAKP